MNALAKLLDFFLSMRGHILACAGSTQPHACSAPANELRCEGRDYVSAPFTDVSITRHFNHRREFRGFSAIRAPHFSERGFITRHCLKLLIQADEGNLKLSTMTVLNAKDRMGKSRVEGLFLSSGSVLRFRTRDERTTNQYSSPDSSWGEAVRAFLLFSGANPGSRSLGACDVPPTMLGNITIRIFLLWNARN